MIVKYFESCAGCGMQRRGLENACKEIGIESESKGISEVSPKALIGYAAIHEEELLKETIKNDEKDKTVVKPDTIADLLMNKGIGQFEGTATRPEKIDWHKKNKGKAFEYMKLVSDADHISMNRGDMNKVEDLPEGLDIFFSSTPCTSVSVAGYNAGMEKGSGTPSALAWDVSRLIASTRNKPKVVIFENVKGMVSGKNLDQFNSLVKEIQGLGYNTYWKILNAKWFGVPQNRERIFFVAIREDIDTGTFEFPVEFDSGIRLIDILQDNVDDKYYISNDKAKKLIEDLKAKNELDKMKNGINIEKNEVNKIGSLHMVNGSWSDPQVDRVYGMDGISPTISTCQGGNRQPKIAVPVLTPDRLNKRQNGRRFKTDGEPAFTLTSVDRHGVMIDGNEDHHIYCEEEGFDIAIRKLTPEECFVLMGMTIDDCKKCREYGLTDTDLYKIAGNGLVTNCVQYIVEHLYKALVDISQVTTDEKMLGGRIFKAVL